MCNAGSASLGAQAFGLGMSTVGSMFAASSRKSQLRSQARLAEINAKIMDSNARNTIRAGTIEESRVKLATSQAKSAQRARMAASGIDIAGSSTALARLTGTDLLGEVDAQTVRSNALRAAWGQRMEAGNLRRGAASAEASADSISPLMSGMTTLIGGAGKVAASWYSLKQNGAFEDSGVTGEVALVEDPGGRASRAGLPQSRIWPTTPSFDTDLPGLPGWGGL